MKERNRSRRQNKEEVMMSKMNCDLQHIVSNTILRKKQKNWGIRKISLCEFNMSYWRLVDFTYLAHVLFSYESA
jgi:hypothetical protein